ncbi:MAG: hypothetical protein NPINA01_10540 [Nitrospinaceae bacterium]|nr:MAG: hypothetical protein NPINA01_10540 [Nitrospinaceae bacterium]
MTKNNFLEFEGEQDDCERNKSPAENIAPNDNWIDFSIPTGMELSLLEISKAWGKVQQRTAEYDVMHRMAKGLHNSDSMENMLKAAMSAVTFSKAFNFEKSAGVFLINGNTREISLVSSIGDFSKAFSSLEKEILFRDFVDWENPDSEEESLSNCCLINPRNSQILDDIENQGLYIVPLKGHTGLIGLLILFASESTPSYERNREILLSIGGLIADAIQHYFCLEKAKKQNEELEKANKKLKELNELKNKFLGIASHDLRTPLYLISAYSEILKDESMAEVKETRKKIAGKIFTSTKFMKNLLDNLLNISKIESGHYDLDKKNEDFNRLAKEQVEIHQFIAQKKGIKIRFNMGPVPPVNCDKNAIIQIMGNFIGNAIKFSPPNSTICVFTEKNDDSVRFSVKDEGPGICLDEQKLLFGEFQTLTPKPTGGEKSTGLGLAIVKKLVNLHAGTVGVTCETGKGSTFFFDLPV